MRAKDSCVCAHERIGAWECWRGRASNPKIGQEMVWARFRKAEASADHESGWVDHPELTRMARRARSGWMFMAVRTSEAPPPRLQAEPVETWKPARLRRATHLVLVPEGMRRRDVFQRRGAERPGISRLGRALRREDSKESRGAARVSVLLLARKETAASHAASMAAAAGVFSVPARREDSWGPPRRERKRWREAGILRMPMPLGPPNL